MANQLTHADLDAIARKHGFVPSHEVDVHHMAPLKPITRYCYSHNALRGVEGLLLGFYIDRISGWRFCSHASGSGRQTSLPCSKMDKYLKSQVARYIAKTRKAGHCLLCGRNCTAPDKPWLHAMIEGKYCSHYCADIAGDMAKAGL